MQSVLRRSASRLLPSLRGMGTAVESVASQETYWARYFPKAPEASPEANKKAMKKEMLGFLLLGPVGAAFMIYDFIVGLEEEHEVTIPPYPWMRIRRVPGMPWGEDCLFEQKPRVAKVWPPEDGIPASHH